MVQKEWMDLPRGLTLSFDDQPAAANREALNDALVEFKRPHLRDPAFGRIGLFVRDGGGALMAGLVASFYVWWNSAMIFFNGRKAVRRGARLLATNRRLYHQSREDLDQWQSACQPNRPPIGNPWSMAAPRCRPSNNVMGASASTKQQRRVQGRCLEHAKP
jgi:hypothetical protein